MIPYRETGVPMILISDEAGIIVPGCQPGNRVEVRTIISRSDVLPGNHEF